MGALIDLTGQRFGHWLVLERASRRNNQGEILWHCVCDCGNHVDAAGVDLRRGRSRQCRACQGKQYRLPAGEAAFRKLWRDYKNRALLHSLEWNVTQDQFRELSQQLCFYCGGAPAQLASRPESGSTFTYNGLDRRDNSLGYTLENVVPCCKHCNLAKNTMSVEEFREWARRLCDHFCQESK